MAKKDFLKNINQVTSSAALDEQKKSPEKPQKKKKLISLPVEWEEKIKAYYGGSVNAYILIAIQERMQKDGLL